MVMFSERRKHPRIQKSLDCEVAVGRSSFRARTQNLSCGGALCRLAEPVAPLTKLEINLQLPPVARVPACQIRCRGIVVRQEPVERAERRDAYLTAIFFSDIKDEDRKRLAEFVLQGMLERARRPSG